MALAAQALGGRFQTPLISNHHWGMLGHHRLSWNGCRSRMCAQGADHMKSRRDLLVHRGRGPRHICKSAEDSVTPQSTSPFTPEDYHEVAFLPVPYGPIVVYKQSQGVIGFFQKSEGPFPSSGDTEVFEIYVGGDVVDSIWRLGRGDTGANEYYRPLTQDMLWSLLQHFQQQAGPNWALLRVAIVGAAKDVYLARAVFGNPLTGEVLLDMDCRPSDACWLAYKSNAPMYIRKELWDKERVAFHECRPYQLIQQHGITFAVHVKDEAWVWPEEVQLLRKQLEVAVKEEDYTSAIKLRDHPFMQMYNQITRLEEQRFDTKELRTQLEGMILESRGQRNAVGEEQ